MNSDLNQNNLRILLPENLGLLTYSQQWIVTSLLRDICFVYF